MPRSNFVSNFFFFFSILLLTQSAIAQRIELGAGLGPSNYRGDITPTPNLKNTTFTAYARFIYSLNKFLNFRLNLSYTKLDITYGNGLLSDTRPEAGYFFNSNLFESQLGLEYHFLDFNVKEPNPRISPYIHLALGLLAYKTKTPTNADELFVPIERTYNLGYGIGLKYRLNKKFNITTELATRNSFSDNIDFVVGEGTNPSRKDTYYVWSFGLSYRFPTSSCRPFLNGPTPVKYRKFNRKYDRPF